MLPRSPCFAPILLIVAASFVLFVTSSLYANVDDPEGNPARILVLHAYSQEYPWTANQHEGFVETLGQIVHRPLDIKTEYLDTKRRRLDDLYADQIADYLRAKYAGYSPDAIYVTDDDGLNFALAKADSLFPGVPIFFSGVNDYSHLGNFDRKKVTGVFERKEILPNLDLLQQIVGDVGRILIVGDGSATYNAIENELKKELASDGSPVTFIASPRIDVLLQELERHPKQSVILTTLGAVQNDSGKVLPLKEIISRITHTKHEIFISMEDGYLFDDVLGGYVTSGYAQGSTAAKLLGDYLGGRPVAEIATVTASPNEYLFNDQTIESLNLQLPAEIFDRARLINPRANWIYDHRDAIVYTIIVLSLAFAGSLLAYVWVLVTKNRQLTVRGRQLRESEQTRQRESRLLEDVERLSKTGGWQIDLFTKHLVWSSGTYRIHEASPDFWPVVEDAINFYVPEDRPKITAVVETGLVDGTPWDLELSIITATGKRKFVRAIGEAVFSDGKPVILRGTFQDITERKAFEQELDDARRQAENASEAKSQFLAAMSHELRTPLNAIIGFADIISRRYLGAGREKKYQEYADDIRSSGEHLLSLINNILDISTIEARRHSLHIEELNAGEIIDECVTMLGESAHAKGIKLEVSDPAEDERLNADRLAVRQILLNLVSNAIKFTGQGGKVGIAAVATGKTLTIKISDTGVGIPVAEIAQITEPFTRGERDPHRAVEGWGLGLSIARSLVEQHGGILEISSELGVGTTVAVSFPTKVISLEADSKNNRQ